MGMSMGTRLHPLPGGDENETKVWYQLGLGMGMGMTFFYGDRYGIVKPVPAPPRPLPSLVNIHMFKEIKIIRITKDKIHNE